MCTCPQLEDWATKVRGLEKEAIEGHPAPLPHQMLGPLYHVLGMSDLTAARWLTPPTDASSVYKAPGEINLTEKTSSAAA